MFRRCLLAVAGLVLGLLIGCGPVIRTAQRIETARVKAEWALMPNRLDYTVYKPSHTVALATFETLKAELAEAKVQKVELTVDKNFDTSEGKPPVMGEFEIPKDHPAFWLEGLPNTKAPALVNCWKVAFSGKTKDGQKVEVQVRLELVGSDRRTVVSVQVGGRGDASGSKKLIDRITERIQNPSSRPGSPEEYAALKAAFGPGPKDTIDVSEETGEIAIKMG